MFILSWIFSALELWSVNHTWIYKNSELKALKNITFVGKVSNNRPNDLLDVNVY